MRRIACFLVSAALGLGLALSLTAPAWAQKGRSYSSGAPSYSGSRSSGRPSFGSGGSSSRSLPNTRSSSPGVSSSNNRRPGFGFDTPASQAQRHAESQRVTTTAALRLRLFHRVAITAPTAVPPARTFRPGGGWQMPTRHALSRRHVRQKRGGRSTPRGKPATLRTRQRPEADVSGPQG